MSQDGSGPTAGILAAAALARTGRGQTPLPNGNCTSLARDSLVSPTPREHSLVQAFKLRCNVAKFVGLDKLKTALPESSSESSIVKEGDCAGGEAVATSIREEEAVFAVVH